MTVKTETKHARRRMMWARNFFPLGQVEAIDRQLDNLKSVRDYVMAQPARWRYDVRPLHAAHLRRYIGPRGWLP